MMSALTLASVQVHVEWIEQEIAAAFRELEDIEAALHSGEPGDRPALNALATASRNQIAGLEDVIQRYRQLQGVSTLQR